MANSRCSCAADERTVPDMVKYWPGVPAIVTYDRDGQWSVATSGKDLEERAKALEAASGHG